VFNQLKYKIGGADDTLSGVVSEETSFSGELEFTVVKLYKKSKLVVAVLNFWCTDAAEREAGMQRL
jgi:hypothetical protein